MSIDTRTLPDWGPFQMEARLHPDYDSTPDDVEVFTAKQVEAWRNDEWQYVGLEVVVTFQDVEIGSASVWGIECGYIPLTDEDDNLTEDPVTFYDPMADTSPGSFIDDIGQEACRDAEAFIQALTEAKTAA